MWMFAGRGYLYTPHFMPATLNHLLDIGHHSLDVVLVESILRHENVQLIEVRLFAELNQGRQIDVTINDVLHARLRLAHIMNAAADQEGSLDAVRSLHENCVADAGFRNLKSIPLDQDLTGRGRPGTLLRHEFADADVAVIFDDKEN